MDDPWAEEREGLRLECEAMRSLLTDADALLAVVRDNLSRATSDWEDAARPTLGAKHNAILEDVGTFREWLEVNEPTLAALPEHLKDEA